MTEKKVTKRERFNELLACPAVAENPDWVEFLNRQIELLDRKSGANGERKLTPVQKANEKLKEDILEILASEPNKLFSIADIMKRFEDEEISNQKISSMLSQLYAKGGENCRVIRVEEKRKPYFQHKGVEA